MSLAPISCLFSRSYLLRQYSPFEEDVFMEDSDWMLHHLFSAGTVTLCNSVIYKYAYNCGRTINSASYFHYACWIKCGYRKLLFSDEISIISPAFSHLVEEDARRNIAETMKKIWKIHKISEFYKTVDKKEWDRIKQCKWPFIVTFLIRFPFISSLFISLSASALGLYKRIINLNKLCS